jgi:hypothetical protein
MNQLVTVASYVEPSEAHVVRALLESAGLPATVADEHHVTANYPISTALGGVRVQVPREHLEAARELVAAYASGELERELEAELGEAPEACPACGSHRLARHVPAADKALAVTVFLLGGATFPTSESLVECGDCGHAWRREG